MKNIIISMFLCLLLANCTVATRVIKDEPIKNADGSTGRVVVTEKRDFNPIVGIWRGIDRTLCLHVWREPIPDWPRPLTTYEQARMEEEQRIKEEDQWKWDEAERQRGINDARKSLGR